MTIRKVVIATGVVTTLAGTAGTPAPPTAPAAAARFTSPHALASDGGNLFVADSATTPSGRSSPRRASSPRSPAPPAAGGFVDGVGGAARFSRPRGIVADGAGNLYVADSDNDRLRVVAEGNGAVTTLAGYDLRHRRRRRRGRVVRRTDGARARRRGNLYFADG